MIQKTFEELKRSEELPFGRRDRFGAIRYRKVGSEPRSQTNLGCWDYPGFHQKKLFGGTRAELDGQNKFKWTGLASYPKGLMKMRCKEFCFCFSW